MTFFKNLQERDENERGSVSIILIALVVVLVVVVGLVVDSAGKYQTAQAAQMTAASAARAATNALSGQTVKTGDLKLSPREAVTVANSYVQAAGVTGQAYVTGDTITVTVQDDYETIFVSLIGITTLHVTATASAKTITEE